MKKGNCGHDGGNVHRLSRRVAGRAKLSDLGSAGASISGRGSCRSRYLASVSGLLSSGKAGNGSHRAVHGEIDNLCCWRTDRRQNDADKLFRSKRFLKSGILRYFSRHFGVAGGDDDG